jgi:NitT/TauT family transport system substrate-binding protein
VPGSENRIIAMMNGQIKATIVDLANKNTLLSKAGDKFHVLPGVDEPASDELVFASENWLKDNREQANIIVEELHKLWREMKANPGIIEQERAKRNLLADQPKEVLDEVVPFYTEAAKEGIYAALEDPAAVAKVDFQFYTEAGQMEGPADSLKVEDFWDLGPLEAAKKTLGG